MRGDDVKKASDLFEKYRKTLKAPERSVVNTFCEVVEDLIAIPLRPEQVSYTPATKVIALTAGGPLRSEIKLHKEEILAHLKGRLGTHNAPREII